MVRTLVDGTTPGFTVIAGINDAPVGSTVAAVERVMFVGTVPYTNVLVMLVEPALPAVTVISPELEREYSKVASAGGSHLVHLGVEGAIQAS
jgi:hypothetical protein